MLYSVKQIVGYKLGALDGEIGHVEEFYFDDKDWVIRYLVADTGEWLSGRTVLISPYALGGIHAGGKMLEVKLTREKVENSPSIDTQLPVAQQHEVAYYRYYNWPVYWEGPYVWGMNSLPFVPPLYKPPTNEEAGGGEAKQLDSHLRSTQEVIDYTIQALDGEIGHVEDFLIDDAGWAIQALIAATGHWWSGKKVLVPPKSIQRVSWDESKVFVNLSRSALMEEPEYSHSISGAKDHDS
jgi:PRC-barrel domain